jgi:myo-inositol-1(or 4)-monophosphatase
MNKALDFARKTAHHAGEILMKHFGQIETIQYKEVDSIVTEADVEAEQAVRKALHATYPDHAVLGEEEGYLSDPAEYTWVIDPLDGTTNYAAGFPYFGVSIALFQEKKPVLGLIYDPIRRNTYTAVENEPAKLNGRPIHVNKKELTLTSLGGFGSTISRETQREIPRKMVQHCKARNLGTTVLHLAWVAAGQWEFVLAERIKLWDIAAGGLIVQRAGGIFTDIEGGPVFPLKRSFADYAEADMNFLASNGKVHQKVLEDIVR